MYTSAPWERTFAFVPEILPPLLDSYARSSQMERAERFLRDILARYHGISPVLALTHLYEQRDGEKPAIEFQTSQLRQRPSVRGLMALIDATMDKSKGKHARISSSCATSQGNCSKGRRCTVAAIAALELRPITGSVPVARAGARFAPSTALANE